MCGDREVIRKADKDNYSPQKESRSVSKTTAHKCMYYQVVGCRVFNDTSDNEARKRVIIVTDFE